LRLEKAGTTGTVRKISQKLTVAIEQKIKSENKVES
jgi:hypothetical protein